MLDQCCPYCSEPLEVDALHTPDHDVLVDWFPCCLDARDEVEAFGWEAFTGATLVEALNDCTGLDARTVEEDGPDHVVLWPLTTHAPGAGVKGWQGRVFRAVDEHHRHHGAPQGWKFGVAVYNGPKLVGVAVVGRPVSRMLQQLEPGTLEVTRVCTWGRAIQRYNAASKLYGLCAREAKRLGYDELITYTLPSENGASVRAAGFTADHQTKGGSWNRPSRGRTDKAPTTEKTRWRRQLRKRRAAA